MWGVRADAFVMQRSDAASHVEMTGDANPPSSVPLPLPASEMLSCHLCPMQFCHQMALRQHLRITHGETLEKVEFSMLNDSYMGMPTCRHCGHRFRYWLGLRQHISNQVCEQKRQGQSLYDQVSPMVSSPEFAEKIGTNDWGVLLADAEFCKHASFHCVFCHQWFPRAASLGYQLQRIHAGWYRDGQEWFQNRIQAKVFDRTTPCGWCGASLVPSSLPKHLCPVVVQLGALVSFFQQSSADGGSLCSTGECGNTSFGRFRLSVAECAVGGASKQEAQRVCKRPSCRDGRVIRKVKEEGEGKGEGQDEGQEDRGHGGQSCVETGKDGYPHGRPYEQTEAWPSSYSSLRMLLSLPLFLRSPKSGNRCRRRANSSKSFLFAQCSSDA